MGGTSTQQQQQLGNSSQNQNTSFNNTSTLNPYAPAVQGVQGILGGVNSISPFLSPTETSAIAQLTGIGQGGNPFTSGVSNATNTLLGGGGNYSPLINNAYQNYQNTIAGSGITNPANLNPFNTPGFSDAYNTMKSDITNNINQQFAGAGRDLSGANTTALARGLSQGLGGLIQGQYNTNVGNLTSGANSLFNAGNTTAGGLSLLDQARAGLLTSGINASNNAWNTIQSGPMAVLQAQAQARGIPLEALAAEMGITLPAAQAFGTTTNAGTGAGATSGTNVGTGTGQNQMAGATQAMLLANAFKGGLGAGGQAPGGGGILGLGNMFPSLQNIPLLGGLFGG